MDLKVIYITESILLYVMKVVGTHLSFDIDFQNGSGTVGQDYEGTYYYIVCM